MTAKLEKLFGWERVPPFIRATGNLLREDSPRKVKSRERDKNIKKMEENNPVLPQEEISLSVWTKASLFLPPIQSFNEFSKQILPKGHDCCPYTFSLSWQNIQHMRLVLGRPDFFKKKLPTIFWQNFYHMRLVLGLPSGKVFHFLLSSDKTGQ